MSKSHKKYRQSEEYEEKQHHNFKQLKQTHSKKYLKKIDRHLKTTDPKKLYELEEYA